MDEAINAFQRITATPEFRQWERMRSDARHKMPYIEICELRFEGPARER